MRDNMDVLKGKSIEIGSLAEYQDGSVVSREIIKKEVGTVTIFVFDAGQGLSEHSAPFDAMVQIVDGVAEITISGKKNIVKKGELIIMPADEPHALFAHEPFKMILTRYVGVIMKFQGQC
jgi:quercetin dioxygenase-like cupin family protein